MVKEGAAMGGGDVGVSTGLLVLQPTHDVRLVPSKHGEGSKRSCHQHDTSHQKGSSAKPVHKTERDHSGSHLLSAQPYCSEGCQGGVTESDSLKYINGIVEDVWLTGELL